MAGAGTSATEVARGGTLGGRYRLERRIAAGGMATVWLADDAQLGRRVAIKVLSDALAGEPAYRARFRREATVAARLAHPNLVRVFDFGDGERPYLVMEYVPGPTLGERIADSAPVASDRLARELLGALSHIHGAGVVHRDVKPGNVLIGRAGEAKLTDFGIAQPEDATRITNAGEVVGTLRYMAPEVIAGAPATERSDLYSAGVVLAEAAGDGASPSLRTLIDRLRAPDPADRPPSADAALAALGGGGAEAAATAPPTAPTSRLREVEVPLWAILGGLLAVGLVVLALVLAAGGGGSGTGHPTGGEPPGQSKKEGGGGGD